ncbi:LysM peptidoglycan-binding domain-containing protein [Nibribacter ruber]|uniref:LysM peptidoglycan-binding domain-containing protein n=1 Tax=Nibribacter ruber TaxID=2698458 RepID=A0A6P1NQC0_9BACT|nr:LysM peptidoglycan-binding domain-containing protein [Nibribacter ruber]QHL86036.1 LysM peptidoglycan-binding domain-containing protein [Nibribacter ruber]
MLKKFVFVLGCALVSYGAAQAGTLAVRDSVGTQTVNGKIFITHKVEPKETLYALSRKYGVAVGQIVAANKNIDKAIHVGQLVLIPMKGATAAAPAKTATPAAKSAPTGAKPAAVPAAAPAASRTYVVDAKGNRLHTVQPKQTLFAISRLHKVTIDDLKKWNKLTDNTVEIGQELIVGVGDKPNLQATAQKPIYVPEKDDEVAMPKQAGNSAAVAKTEEVKPAPAAAKQPTPVRPVTAKPAIPTTLAKAGAPKTETATTATSPAPAPAPVSTPTKSAEEKDSKSLTVTTEYTPRVSESGMAEAIDQKVDANKFLALHKTAPVGTIMAVKNPMNNQTVYVRVIGKLPETGENEKVVIKLSKKACQQIGANDGRFRVELSYMP